MANIKTKTFDFISLANGWYSVAVLNWGFNREGSHTEKDVFVKYVYMFNQSPFDADDCPPNETISDIQRFCNEKGLNLYSY